MRKLLLALFIGSAALHANPVLTAELTTVQTTVFDSATNGHVSYGPLAMAFTYDVQTYRNGLPVPITQFSLPGFTALSLYLYPHSGGFDGLDVLGTASNGDAVSFGYAFADGSLSTPGTHPPFGSNEIADNPVLVVSGVPEPSSVRLFAIVFVASSVFWGSSLVSAHKKSGTVKTNLVSNARVIAG